MLCLSTPSCSLSGCTILTQESASFRMSRACLVPSKRTDGCQRARGTPRRKKCAKPSTRQLPRPTQSRRIPKLSRNLERSRKWSSCGQRSSNYLLCARNPPSSQVCSASAVASQPLPWFSPPWRCILQDSGRSRSPLYFLHGRRTCASVSENACHPVTWQSIAMTSSLRFSPSQHVVCAEMVIFMFTQSSTLDYQKRVIPWYHIEAIINI